MKQRMRRLFGALSLLSGLGALGVLFVLFGVADVADAFARLSPRHLGLYLFLACAIRLGFSLRWFLVARTLGPAPSFLRFVAARLSGDAVGALIPTGSVGGDPLRIVLLYGSGVRGAAASAGVALDRILELLGNTMTSVVYVTLFSVSFTHLFEGENAAPFAVATLLLLLAALGLPVVLMRFGIHPVTPAVPRRWLTGRPRWSRGIELLRRIEDELIAVVRQRPAVLLWGVAGSLLIEGLVVLEYYFLLAAFGLEVEWTTLLMMLVTVGLVRVIPVPASLGTLEVGQVTLLAAVSRRADLGFLAGVVMRLHETLWILVGLLTLSLQGFSLARLRSAAVDAATPGRTAV